MKINKYKRAVIQPDGTEIPVIDAKFSTIIQPSQSDIEHGVPGSMTACMYAKACKRLFDSEFVVIARTVAYVEVKGKGGEPQIWRFIIRDPARMKIEDFDAGASVTKEAVIFAAPQGRHSLDYKAARKQIHEQFPEVAAMRAVMNRRKKKSPHTIRPLRDPGTGLFQFKKLNH